LRFLVDENPKITIKGGNMKQQSMAQKYEAAWHKLFYTLPRWEQRCVIEEHDGRHASELAHQAACLAETTDEPILAPSGNNPEGE